MSTWTRKWLRTFLNLGARATKDGIPQTDVERQEDTVLRALAMLDQRPGVVLADEVGMGKTYEALGVAAAMRFANPRSRIVVVTPGPDLNTKWFSEFDRFRDMYNFGDDVREARSLADFVQIVRRHPVVVAPVTMFQSGRGSGEQAYLLSLYCHWKQVHGRTASAILARFRNGEHGRADVRSEKFLDVFDLDRVTPHLRAAFQRGRGGGAAGLDDLYEQDGLAAFNNPEAVRKALYRARFVLTGKLMPMIDLLIVDEAHKLKNPGSLRTQAMKNAFERRFRKALFLTATPFQLDVVELQEVFSLFAGAKDASTDLEEQVADLLTAVADYQRQYEAFQRTWAALDPAVAARFAALYDGEPTAVDAADEPSLKVVAGQVATLKALKTQTIEPGFRQWMIRSLREDKRTYRRPLRKILRAGGAGALPFLIYERFIAELFRRHRQTHKAAVEINMVSSYAAAQRGAILATEAEVPAQAEAYRDLLRAVLGDIEAGAHDHPKMRDVLSDALDAAEQDEKTLIFCSRIATLEQLRREFDVIWAARILERWRGIYPGAQEADIFDTHESDAKRQRGRHSLLQARFHRPQDALYLALREPYLRTLAPLADWALQRLPVVVDEANRILRDAMVGRTAAERLDYQLAKRCVEQAAARLWMQGNASTSGVAQAIEPLSDPDYVRLGLDLTKDEFEEDSVGNEPPGWQISARVAETVVGTGGSLWERQADLLGTLPRDLRVRVVEQLARYLTYKQVPFLADLLTEAKAVGIATDPVESAALLAFLPRFWETAAGRVVSRQVV